MREPFRSSEHYHSRAEECRAVATLFTNEVTRAKMLTVADDYDKMACTAAVVEASLRTVAALDVAKKVSR